MNVFIPRVSKNYFILIFCVLILFSACNKNKYYSHEGFTQGTTFHIKYEYSKNISKEIDSLLKQFSCDFSNYDSLSLISKINRNETDSLNPLMEKMFKSAIEIANITDGALDITIAPIANVWGFGWKGKNDNFLPDSTLIDSLMTYVGIEKIKIKNHKIIKSNPKIQIITNAIAQGLSSDYISDYFTSLGIENFLVEIGGEIFCKGMNPNQKKWTIGIEKPVNSAEGNRENELLIELSDKSIVTSGNYRKFFENGGKKYAHTINPKTGFPSENSLISVSVISNSAMLSDGLATAFMVLGLKKSIKIVNSLSDVEAFFISIDDNGNENIFYSENFEQYIKKQELKIENQELRQKNS
ncbi:MAG: FAD:protein FMN transferase [Bacteroidales bacterium]|jgi:thiamine biosynthesis lipoprotein|nr:FAD:protein FMN transferase [Bacteroidales bacterium]